MTVSGLNKRRTKITFCFTVSLHIKVANASHELHIIKFWKFYYPFSQEKVLQNMLLINCQAKLENVVKHTSSREG